ncbi:Glucosamine 6-phosphate N-acetyltransferase 1 [Porphyridium purpureum]|uniref:Glucosamine 6-phosphate N-acetyltransferase n=1 Tax=Porphyridium purpureum TaxID=35688 RepID=A0A5J4ZB51_PORPP|nr:Glucosamine 6-phosphate N-acetyltransferase 1 [Porphyridium purpureum]|eukprot:POR4056..scf295_1
MESDSVGISVRALRESDYDTNLFSLLSQLSIAPVVPREQFEQRFREMFVDSRDYVTLVAEDAAAPGVLLGAATLLVQRKILRGCAIAGHIEDVVVDARQRRTGVGKRLIVALVERARERGCYKVILDCSEENMPFYESCGFTSKHTIFLSVQYIKMISWPLHAAGVSAHIGWGRSTSTSSQSTVPVWSVLDVALKTRVGTSLQSALSEPPSHEHKIPTHTEDEHLSSTSSRGTGHENSSWF